MTSQKTAAEETILRVALRFNVRDSMGDLIEIAALAIMLCILLKAIIHKLVTHK